MVHILLSASWVLPVSGAGYQNPVHGASPQLNRRFGAEFMTAVASNALPGIYMSILTLVLDNRYGVHRA
jgi:hypothetical protein